MHGIYTIGETAAITGMSAATLRLWERQGLLQPVRTPGGSRRYSEEDVTRLRRIQYLRRVERLNPAGIARLLRSEAGGAESPMSNSAGPAIGERLRVKRNRAGLTLRQVAERIGISVSFLSAVERGVTSPSIATLHQLTREYGITVLELLADGRETGRLVRAADRPHLPTSSGVRIEQLAHGTLAMEPQIFVVPPGAGSDGAYDHIGEEFIFVLRGTLDIWLEEAERYQLAEGDCLYFPSTLSHRWHNPGTEETELLWVNTPPTF